LEAPDSKTARKLLNDVLEEYKEKAPKAMEVLEEGFEDATAVLELPEQYRRRLRTTEQGIRNTLNRGTADGNR
jgi:transposase-like protein